MKKLRSYFNAETLSYIIAAVAVVLLFVLLQNLSAVWAVVGRVAKLLAPFTVGILLAYVLNLVMRPIEKRLLKGIKRRGLKRGLSLALALLIFLAILAFIVYAIIPNLVSNIVQLVGNIQRYLGNTTSVMADLGAWLNIADETLEWIFGTWDEIVTYLTDLSRRALPLILNFSMQFGSGLVNAFISLFFAIYILIDKEKLVAGLKRVLRALLREKAYDGVYATAKRAHVIFTQYIIRSGFDALIVGFLIFIAMSIFIPTPYTLLIAVVMGLTNLIPKFGPIIGAIPSVLLLLLVSPIKALFFIIIVVAVQILDSNFITPKVLKGNSSGLSGFWVLVAIWICSSIWGVGGLVLGVPLFAVVYHLAKGLVTNRLAKRGLDADGNPVGDSEEPAAGISEERPGEGL